MCAEGPVRVVVLPVDVARDRAADGDEPGPGCHRDEPTQRDDLAQQAVEADAGIDRGDTGGRIDADRIGTGEQLDDRTSAVLRRIAVRPAETAGDDTAMTDRLLETQLVDRRTPNGRHRGSRPAPTGQCTSFGLHEEPRLLATGLDSR